jgi:type III pantothenate kinase
MGTGTASSLASGAFHGLLMEVWGFIAHFTAQHPGLAVVIGGGDALRFATALKSGIFAHPSLTLIGLHALLHYDPRRAAAARP